MINVVGIGWVDQQQYGCIRLGTRTALARESSLLEEAKRENLFAFPVKNFGRFDFPSRITCYAIALALKDAGITYAAGLKQDMGLLGTSVSGCIEANRNYFTDYVECGRTLSRGNLFIYTLPSSPLAEAAIHFGIQGPLLYVTNNEKPLLRLIRMAAGMIDREETQAVLVAKIEDEASLCMVLSGGHTPDGEKVCDLDAIGGVAQKSESVTRIVEAAEQLRKEPES